MSRPKQGWFLPHSSIEPAQSTPTRDHHTILMKTPPRHIFERHWYNQQFRMLQMFAATCNVVQWPSQQRPCCRNFCYSSHGACQLAAPTKFQYFYFYFYCSGTYSDSPAAFLHSKHTKIIDKATSVQLGTYNNANLQINLNH